MPKMLIYALLPCLALAGYFSDHREKYLNKSVSPCQDFYRHVCPENFPRRKFFTSLENELKEHLKWRFSEEFNLFNTAYEKINSTLNSGLEDHLKILNELPFNFSQEVDLPTDLEIEKYLKPYCSGFNCNYETGTSHLYRKLQNSGLLEAYSKYLNALFVSRIQEVSTVFAIDKQKILRIFRETAWMDEYCGSHKEVLKRLEDTILKSISIEDVSFAPFYRQGLHLLRNCFRDKKNANAGYCLAFAMTGVLRGVESEISETSAFMYILSSITNFGARFGLRQKMVFLAPSLYSTLYDNWASLLGSLNMIIGHELAHSAFAYTYPVDIPSSSKCFQDHMEGVCNRFFTNRCPTGNMTYGEDGADFVSMKINLEILSQILKAKKEEYREFFYANAIVWCGHDQIHKNDEHSVGYVRVNGIMRQFPEFAEAFDCKPGDYMVQNEDEKCALVGVDAPPTL